MPYEPTADEPEIATFQDAVARGAAVSEVAHQRPVYLRFPRYRTRACVFSIHPVR